MDDRLVTVFTDGKPRDSVCSRPAFIPLVAETPNPNPNPGNPGKTPRKHAPVPSAVIDNCVEVAARYF